MATQFLLVQTLANMFHHRRAGHEHGTDILHQYGIMAGRKACRPQARNRTQAQAHNRHGGHILGQNVKARGIAKAAG